MANADSNTFKHTEMTKDQTIIAEGIAALLKMPLSAKDDLFHVLHICRCRVDELIEIDNHAEYLALAGRLLAGFSVLRVVLEHPPPPHLIELLKVEDQRGSRLRRDKARRRRAGNLRIRQAARQPCQPYEENSSSSSKAFARCLIKTTSCGLERFTSFLRSSLRILNSSSLLLEPTMRGLAT